MRQEIQHGHSFSTRSAALDMQILWQLNLTLQSVRMRRRCKPNMSPDETQTAVTLYFCHQNHFLLSHIGYLTATSIATAS